MLSRALGLLPLLALSTICAPGGSAFTSARTVPESVAIQEEAGDKAEPASLSQQIKQWRDASAEHIPGKADPPAVMIGKWNADDLQSVLTYIKKLSGQSPSTAKRTLARSQIRRLLGLTDLEAKNGDLGRVLKQGALLHTDIALMELGTAAPEHAGDVMGLFADGRLFFSSSNPHWQFARQLLDSVALPSQDPLVRQWYVSTTAYMQSRRDLGYSGRNLKAALDLFPRDDRILFYSGVLHEIYASPVSQNSTLPPGWKISYGSRESELRRAQQFLQRAVSANPNFMEARLHLGRVSGLIGNHQLAISELQQAAAAISDPQLRYYAWLYLGFEMAMQVQRIEAQDYYERASKLFPTAQSPLLALSQLARSGNDVTGALTTLQRVFALNVTNLWKDDPLWSYDLSHVRNAAALVAEMHRMFGALPR